MKYLKSQVTTSLDAMQLTKVRLVVNGEDPENIWVKKDGKGKCYLQNNALSFSPFPSWGMELPYAATVDVAEIRGESPDDTIIRLHPDAWKNYEEFVDEDGEFLWDKYQEQSE